MQGWRELTEGRLYLMSVEEREYDLETFPSCPFNLAVLVSNESDLKIENVFTECEYVIWVLLVGVGGNKLYMSEG